MDMLASRKPCLTHAHPNFAEAKPAPHPAFCSTSVPSKLALGRPSQVRARISKIRSVEETEASQLEWAQALNRCCRRTDVQCVLSLAKFPLRTMPSLLQVARGLRIVARCVRDASSQSNLPLGNIFPHRWDFAFLVVLKRSCYVAWV